MEYASIAKALYNDMHAYKTFAHKSVLSRPKEGITWNTLL